MWKIGGNMVELLLNDVEKFCNYCRYIEKGTENTVLKGLDYKGKGEFYGSRYK